MTSPKHHLISPTPSPGPPSRCPCSDVGHHTMIPPSGHVMPSHTVPSPTATSGPPLVGSQPPQHPPLNSWHLRPPESLLSSIARHPVPLSQARHKAISMGIPHHTHLMDPTCAMHPPDEAPVAGPHNVIMAALRRAPAQAAMTCYAPT